MIENTTPARLITRLAVYFLALISLIVVLFLFYPETLRYLPFGGTHALGETDIEITATGIDFAERVSGRPVVTPEIVRDSLVFLLITLACTTLVMLPITWTYSATKFDDGPARNFVRALVILPICATTVVLLIQDSLALAFGLAALVAAVRFRVALTDAIDGIYVFAAIGVGLAAGIGYLGIGTIMALVFCLVHAVLWRLDYGRNPLDDVRRATQQAKERRKLEESAQPASPDAPETRGRADL